MNSRNTKRTLRAAIVALGGAVGYIVGTEMYHNGYYGRGGYYGGY